MSNLNNKKFKSVTEKQGKTTIKKACYLSILKNNITDGQASNITTKHEKAYFFIILFFLLPKTSSTDEENCSHKPRKRKEYHRKHLTKTYVNDIMLLIKMKPFLTKMKHNCNIMNYMISLLEQVWTFRSVSLKAGF